MENGSERPSPSEPADRLAPADAARASQPSELNRLTCILYNHNPFYLVSCLLVIYGFQDLALTEGQVVEKTLTMTGGIGVYALLMAVVCVAVVRLAKVWEDARSLLLVVLISLVAARTGFDELCIADQTNAIAIAGVVSAIIFACIESVLWLCRLRLSFWYRLSLYSHFAILVASPLILGRAVAERNDALANYGSLLFSIAISTTLLMLIPAVRRGNRSIEQEKSSKTDPSERPPWSWPLYPLSAFVVLWVLSGIRAHAIWVSFGFYGTAGKFEPFLLMPLLAATIVVMAETGIGLRSRRLMKAATLLPPFLLLCGVTRGGATWLPMHYDLTHHCGSALTVCCAATFLIYAWLTARHVPHASFGLPGTLLLTASVAPMPTGGWLADAEAWMLVALSAMMLLAMALRRKENQWMWAFTSCVFSIAIAMAGQAHGEQTIGLMGASVFALTSMLIIGAFYDSKLASVLRNVAAIAMTMLVCFALSRAVLHEQYAFALIAIGLCVTSLAYGYWIARKGWLLTSALQAMFLVVALSVQSHRSGALQRVNWPLASGAACLCIGCVITTAKTGILRRLIQRRTVAGSVRFRSGL